MARPRDKSSCNAILGTSAGICGYTSRPAVARHVKARDINPINLNFGDVDRLTHSDSVNRVRWHSIARSKRREDVTYLKPETRLVYLKPGLNNAWLGEPINKLKKEIRKTNSLKRIRMAKLRVV